MNGFDANVSDHVPCKRTSWTVHLTVMYLEVVQGHRPRYRHASLNVSPTLNVPGSTGFLRNLSNAGFMVSGPPVTS